MTKSNLSPAQQKFYEALLSGKYHQGFGQLRDSQDNYCVLGVACDTYEKAQKKFYLGQPSGWEFDYSDKSYRYLSHTGFCIPEEVIRYLGLSRQQELELMIANDAGHDFESLAQVFLDMIEAKRERQLDQLEDVLEDHRP